KDFEHALDDYSFVAEKTSGNYKERAILQCARIHYTVTFDYKKAYEYYQLLSLSADYKENLSEALKGMMNSAWKMNDWSKTSEAADKILANPSSPADDLNEARYYSAKVAMINKDYAKAEDLFTKVSKGNNSTTGAEALYNIALIYFNENKNDEAEKQCYKVIEQKPSYNYWIAKSYLLLGDIFFSENDLFNAKATLQSIIDNYKTDDDILPEAKSKLQQVTEKENQQSKVMQDSVEHSFQMDTLDQK
ncbi:MAG: tetratricopeptide repeat protein, partial [Bacteroidota bacterium]